MTVLPSIVQSDQDRALLREALFDDDPTVRSLAAFWLAEGVLKGRWGEVMQDFDWLAAASVSASNASSS